MPRKKPGATASMAEGTKAKKAKPAAKAPKKPRSGSKAKVAPKVSKMANPAPTVTQKLPWGRPTAYSAEIADEVLDRMHNGQTLNEICRDDHMPAERTVRRWNMDDVHGFSPRYKAARSAIIDYWADEIVVIGDNATNDWMERRNGEGESIGWQANGDHISRSRLRVETRKWLLSKLRPDQYGERSVVNHGITNEFAAFLGQIDGDGASLV